MSANKCSIENDQKKQIRDILNIFYLLQKRLYLIKAFYSENNEDISIAVFFVQSIIHQQINDKDTDSTHFYSHYFEACSL